MKRSASLVSIILSLAVFSSLVAEEITVFAAASLSDSLKDVAAAYEKAGGDKVRFNFAGSNTLARQIEAGAPADVFFPADDAQMDGLVARGLVASGTRKELLGNTLVIVTAPDGPALAKMADLAGASIARFAMGDPLAVPAGVYARKSMEQQGLWTLLRPKVIPVESVRAALSVVESGNVDAGIVYKTDAAVSNKVKIALEIPTSETLPIIYPVAMVADSRHATAARKFILFLIGKEAAAVFVKYGFTLLSPTH